jgi:hypothetical protein
VHVERKGGRRIEVNEWLKCCARNQHDKTYLNHMTGD